MCRKQCTGWGQRLRFSVHNSPQRGTGKTRLHGMELQSLVGAFPGPPKSPCDRTQSGSWPLLPPPGTSHPLLPASASWIPLSGGFLGPFASEPTGPPFCFLDLRFLPPSFLLCFKKWEREKLFSWPGPKKISLELQPVGIYVVPCPVENLLELSGGNL